MATRTRPAVNEVPSAPPAGPGVLKPHRPAYAIKRAVLGPALPTSQLANERLGKPTALAVFASDNLSSVAYATEEILKVGVPLVGALAFSLLMPVTFGILAVLAILLFSYRQTIKAYPSAGGAYIVTRDNFGLLPAQVAGVALLTDYVLTVSVSIAAGVAAITSAAPGLYPYRVELSVAFIWFIAWGNLRGVRESGRMFAVPTYFFILMMFVLLGSGLVRAVSGTLHPIPLPDDMLESTGAISLFLVLHAFASGGAAVTGVEAISNGVPAFRPPEWRNARTTLMWMGSLLGVMFLGLSFLAYRLQVVPTEAKTVISQVGRAVFGDGPLGYGLFLGLQIATTMILILAANTSFADFPRLANFHAGDNFMPRQLTKRGHRLVFSNGIVGLAIAATALVVLFRADVHRLIPLYAIGVFTSFTLSQAGMARRHLRLREPGWRHGLAINAIGAVTTGVVTVIVAITKFSHGAWAVMVFVPVMVLLLVRMNRRYDQEREDLEDGLTRFSSGRPARAAAVLLVDDVDPETIHAIQYAKTTRPSSVHALSFEDGDPRFLERWARLGTDIPLVVMRDGRDHAGTVAEHVAAMPGDGDVNVILPRAAAEGPIARLVASHDSASLTKALLAVPRATVTIVRDHAGPGHATTPLDDGRVGVRLTPRPSHRVIVPVDHLDRAVLRAIRYALSLDATEVRAVHAAIDHDGQETLIRHWMDLAIPIDLDVIECWDRNIARSLEGYVVERMRGRAEITVVLPRRDVEQIRYRILHDRTSRRIAKALGGYEHVDIAIVPSRVGNRYAMEPTE